MSWVEIITVSLLVAYFGWLGFHFYRKKKRGESLNSCGCGGCGGCGAKDLCASQHK